jgi:hypothetical protein
MNTPMNNVCSITNKLVDNCHPLLNKQNGWFSPAPLLNKLYTIFGDGERYLAWVKVRFIVSKSSVFSPFALFGILALLHKLLGRIPRIAPKLLSTIRAMMTFGLWSRAIRHSIGGIRYKCLWLRPAYTSILLLLSRVALKKPFDRQIRISPYQAVKRFFSAWTGRSSNYFDPISIASPYFLSSL